MDNKTFINNLASSLNKSSEEVESVIASFSGLIIEAVKDLDTVAVPGFGQFEPKLREERITNHPSTGKRILVPPKLSMVFKPSSLLKNKIKK